MGGVGGWEHQRSESPNTPSLGSHSVWREEPTKNWKKKKHPKSSRIGEASHQKLRKSAFVVLFSFPKKGRCLCPCCRPAQATIRWFAPSHKTLFSLALSVSLLHLGKSRQSWLALHGHPGNTSGSRRHRQLQWPFPAGGLAGERASGRVGGSVPARALSPERNVGARRAPLGTRVRTPLADRAGGGGSFLAPPPDARRGRCWARRGEGEAGRGGGRGTRARGEAVGGERRAAGGEEGNMASAAGSAERGAGRGRAGRQ